MTASLQVWVLEPQIVIISAYLFHLPFDDQGWRNLIIFWNRASSLTKPKAFKCCLFLLYSLGGFLFLALPLTTKKFCSFPKEMQWLFPWEWNLDTFVQGDRPSVWGWHSDSVGHFQGIVWHWEVTCKIEYMVPLLHIKAMWAVLELRDTKNLISPIAKNYTLQHVLSNYKSLHGHECHIHDTPQWHNFKVAESPFIDYSSLITPGTAPSATLCSARAFL